MNENNNNIICEITDQPINTSKYIEIMKRPDGGSLSIFLGTTRDNFENKKVIKLFYEAHPTMAIKKMNEIANFCVKKWNLLAIAIVHRTGEVVCC